jgi:hypothetical protein
LYRIQSGRLESTKWVSWIHISINTPIVAQFRALITTQ